MRDGLPVLSNFRGLNYSTGVFRKNRTSRKVFSSLVYSVCGKVANLNISLCYSDKYFINKLYHSHVL